MTTENHRPDIVGPDFTLELKVHVVDILQQALQDEKYRNEFIFGPIDVEERADHDGHFYLHAYVVFDGDESQLDPDWTSTLTTRVRPELIKRGLPIVLSKSFVAKSDWESREKAPAG